MHIIYVNRSGMCQLTIQRVLSILSPNPENTLQSVMITMLIICVSICLFVYIISLFMYLSIHPSVRPSIRLSIHSSIHPSIHHLCDWMQKWVICHMLLFKSSLFIDFVQVANKRWYWRRATIALPKFQI